jgi:hypothetical protein
MRTVGKQIAFSLVSCTYRAIVDFVADVRWRVLYKVRPDQSHEWV